MPWRLVLHGVCALLAALGTKAQAGNERGQDLFNGAAALSGTIVGHTNALPPLSARCVNCHAAGSAGPASAASAPGSFGPLLTRRHLTDAVARRGGPPSRYDQAAFCRLLRQGVDPAYVLIARAMPRYDISDGDCQALWALLTDPKRP
jgi:hypothetical protein